KSQTLKGNFNLNSNYLALSDIMTTASETPEETQKKEADKEQTTTASSEDFKIPSFLDCTITAKANTVVYDNLTLKDVSGKLAIKDETVSLQNVLTSIFGGKIGLNGQVSTKEAKPTFDVNLNLNNLDIAQSFTELNTLSKIAPIAGVISGKLNSTVKLSGLLDAKELTPDLQSLAGDLVGQLLGAKVNAENSKLLSSLDSQVSFIDFNKLNLNNINTHLTFQDGQVHLKPIDLKYEEVKVQFSGSHGFD